MIDRIKHNRLLGIIVCLTRNHPPFAERPYYEQLTRVGKRLGMSVIVFSPKHINWVSREVKGSVYHPNVKQWLTRETTLPAVIYDRCFYLSPAHYQSYLPFVRKLRQDPQTELLGVPLQGKWQLAQLIRGSDQLSPFFPHTERYGKPRDALAFLQKYNAVVAKPVAGSHGRGIIAIFRQAENERYVVVGRTKQNKPLSHTCANLQQTLSWLHRFIGETRYILQPYLQLRTPNHLPFDIRALMQKDEHQTWQMTGMAVRTGSPYSLTSNLHGGGKAEKIAPFLEQLFDNQALKRITQNIHTICSQLPLIIEREHGRLCELGIDIGIDLNARVWLLEVNSKPGRQVFRQAGERDIYLTAIRRPMLYANALLKSESPAQ